MPMEQEHIRRIDGLFVSYGEIIAQLGRFDERGDAWDRAHAEHKAVLKDMRQELMKEIHQVEVECKGFREEYRKDRQRELEGRVSNRTIVIALIAGSFTVLAAIIAAAATILSAA